MSGHAESEVDLHEHKPAWRFPVGGGNRPLNSSSARVTQQHRLLARSSISTAMSQQKRKRDATWSGTIRDWLPLGWRTWENQEGRDETEPLTDGDGERHSAHEDRAGLASLVVSEVRLSLPVRRSRRVGSSRSRTR